MAVIAAVDAASAAAANAGCFSSTISACSDAAAVPHASAEVRSVMTMAASAHNRARSNGRRAAAAFRLRRDIGFLGGVVLHPRESHAQRPRLERLVQDGAIAERLHD